MRTEIDWDELRLRVVRIDSADGTKILGTGFFAAPGWVLTCAHVVGASSHVVIRQHRREHGRVVLGPALVGAEVAARSAPPSSREVLWPFPDMALVDVRGLIANHSCVLFLDQGQPSDERDCYAWGFARREEGVEPGGSPASFRYEGREHDGYLRLKAGQAAPGLSGAPLVCPTRRAVVGVVTASRDIRMPLGGWASPITAAGESAAAASEELIKLGDVVRRANRPAIVAALHEDGASWARVLPIPGAVDLLEAPSVTFRKGPRSTPSQLLHPESDALPYLFREDALAAAVAWAIDGKPMAVMRVAGDGGAGKTRFALELCRRLRKVGWIAGFWSEATASDVVRIPLPRLIVFDYAEAGAAGRLGDVLDELRRHASEIAPVRVLLLTRLGAGREGDLLDEVAGAASLSLQAVVDAAGDSMAADAMPVGQRGELFTVAFGVFHKAWHEIDGAVPAVGELLTDDRYGLPLEILFEALDRAIVDDPGTFRSGHPLKRVLGHEERYWGLTAPDILSPEIRRACVATATLAGADDDAEAHALFEVLLPDPADRLKAVGWLATLYTGPQYLNPLRPDRLGEALVSSELIMNVSHGELLLPHVLFMASDRQGGHALDVLTRLTAYDGQAATALVTLVTDWLGALVARAESLARGTSAQPGQVALAGGLARLLAGELGIQLAAAEPGNTGYQRDLSVSYNRLADLAVATGQGEVAEGLYRRGLTIFERLAAAEPGNTGYQRDLSVSYERLADLARATGQGGVAEGLYRRGLTIAERLAAAEPGNTGYQRDLSISYNNLADLAVATGQGEVAKGLYRQSLTIAERLAAAEPDNTGYQRDLSISYERLAQVAKGERDVISAWSWLSQALELRKGLCAREAGRVDLAEELAYVFYMSALVLNAPEEQAVAREEIIELLMPFERSGRLTLRAAQLLQWARS